MSNEKEDNKKSFKQTGGGPKEEVELTVEEEQIAELANFGAAAEGVKAHWNLTIFQSFDSGPFRSCSVTDVPSEEDLHTTAKTRK